MESCWVRLTWRDCNNETTSEPRKFSTFVVTRIIVSLLIIDYSWGSIRICNILVVYHLHGQTGRSTVWANAGTQTQFSTGKFRPGISFTIYANQFHLPENDRESLKLVSKMALKKWNTNFRLESVFHPDKQDYLFRCSVSAGKTQKVVLHLLSNQISQKMFVNGKQPLTQSSPLLPLIKNPRTLGTKLCMMH